jgi:hypothetical protein
VVKRNGDSSAVGMLVALVTARLSPEIKAVAKERLDEWSVRAVNDRRSTDQSGALIP